MPDALPYRLTDGPHVGDPPLKIQSADVVELNRALALSQDRVRELEAALQRISSEVPSVTPLCKGSAIQVMNVELFWAMQREARAALTGERIAREVANERD